LGIKGVIRVKEETWERICELSFDILDRQASWEIIKVILSVKYCVPELGVGGQ
jgi:hypothetical protein